MQFITLADYFLLPFFLLIIYAVAYFIRKRDYPPGHPWYRYFMTGLTLKIVGAIFIGLIYQYYYGGGDTFMYFLTAKEINNSFTDSPEKWYKLIMHIPRWYDGEYYSYINRMPFYESTSEYAVAAIAAILGILCSTTYLPIAVMFGALSYIGIWALFKTFASKYPDYTRQIAICCLFIPSTVMWGSGLFKDTICMFGLGLLTYGTFQILIQRNFQISVIGATILGFWLIATIKLYILLAFIPALALWILFTFSHRLRPGLTRTTIKIVVIGACVGGFIIFSQKFASELGKYSLENVAQTSYTTNMNIAQVSGDEGSTYSLGDMDPSIGGMLKKFPLAVNVTLFRPYLWETRKIIQFTNAIEASMFLWVTLKILLSLGFRKVKETVGADPTIQFCLIFTIIFAFAVGLSSGNFGTLSRYRIPCLPFYGVALVLIYYKNKPVENNILAFNQK